MGMKLTALSLVGLATLWYFGFSVWCDVIVSETHDAEHVFNHATVDKTTGHIFVGAKNKLYEFSADLTELHSIDTGPKLDNVECSGQGPCEGKEKKPTDNYNKVLVIDYDKKRIIVCGSLFQGICEVRDQRNISVVLFPRTNDTWKFLAANNRTASTVAFIASWHPNPSKNKVLVVGTSYTSFLIDNKLETPDYRGLVPAVSSRSLNDSNLFDFAYQGPFTKTSVTIPNKNLQSLYPISYIYGFSSEGFSYILTVQREKVGLQVNSRYISKVVRICEADPNYYSFTEVTIKCGEYNLMQAAYVGKAGQYLIDSFNSHYVLDGTITTQDDVLFTVFSMSQGTQQGSFTNIPTENSAMCIFPLKYIRKIFMENTQRCFKGDFKAIGWIYGSPEVTPACTAVSMNLHSFLCSQLSLYMYKGWSLYMYKG